MAFQFYRLTGAFRTNCYQGASVGEAIRKVRERLGDQFAFKTSCLYGASDDDQIELVCARLLHSTISKTKRCLRFKLTACVNAIRARTVRPCFRTTLPTSFGGTRTSRRVAPLRSISRTATASISPTDALTIISTLSFMCVRNQ